LKTCTKCGEVKPLEDFHKHNQMPDGRSPRCGPCKNADTKESWARKPPEERRKLSRRRQLWHRYRIRESDYDEMYKSQDGRCAICGDQKPWRGDWLAVDHDHSTGEVRGLLCGECNVGLGKFDDTPDLLRGAANYLEGR
jgi:hypothetical protein